jgi:hypothetical protein
MDPTTVAQALAAYARPARPVTPTPTTQADLMDALYGGGTPPAPLPGWVPSNVQNYINTRPSYAEGQTRGQQWGPVYSALEQEPLQPPQPQIADINRLFGSGILRKAGGSQFGENQISGPFLKSIIQGGNFAGGDNI